MVGRNDPCPCGSGKKYKKCCIHKEAVSVEKIEYEAVERFIQTFYDTYPKEQDLPAFRIFMETWVNELSTYYEEELIGAMMHDEFVFDQSPTTWLHYVEQSLKKEVRPVLVKQLGHWINETPYAVVGEVIRVDEQAFYVLDERSKQEFAIRRETDRPISVGAYVYCYVLSDFVSEDCYFAISTVIFIPIDYIEKIRAFWKATTPNWAENRLSFWSMLGQEGFSGNELSNFETGVVDALSAFIMAHEVPGDEILATVEDYVIEKQPNARKNGAIAAGAVRYAMETGLFGPSFTMTIKAIGEAFDVSTSSLTRYAKELEEYVITRP